LCFKIKTPFYQNGKRKPKARIACLPVKNIKHQFGKKSRTSKVPFVYYYLKPGITSQISKTTLQEEVLDFPRKMLSHPRLVFEVLQQNLWVTIRVGKSPSV